MADALTSQVVSGYYGNEVVPITVAEAVERIVIRPLGDGVSRAERLLYGW
jgi:hypothetical protein